MTYLRNYGKRIWIPIYVFVIDGGDEKFLVDTGKVKETADILIPLHSLSVGRQKRIPARPS